MKLNVEFQGMPRLFTQTRECTLEMPDQATYRDVLRVLADKYPRLVGPIIVRGTFDIEKDLMIAVDGLHAIGSLEDHPREGQQVTVMSENVG